MTADIFDDVNEHMTNIDSQRHAYVKSLRRQLRLVDDELQWEGTGRGRIETIRAWRPTLVLLRKADSGGPRHGGWRTYRHFEIYLNGVLLRSFRDDSASDNYASGKWLDELIDKTCGTLERALGIKRIHAREKGDLALAGYKGKGEWDERTTRRV